MTITTIKSRGPKLSGYGNLFWANSIRVIPVDQTSARIEYDLPKIRSGWSVTFRKVEMASNKKTYSHVISCPQKRVRLRPDEVPGHAEIAKLHYPFTR